MMKKNRVWVSFYMYVLLVAIVGSFLDAAVYRIDSQADFNVYKEAKFKSGDTILFKRGTTFNGMFSPGGNGTDKASICLKQKRNLSKAYGQRARLVCSENSSRVIRPPK